ncbi:HNH endonuclease signature motif containing protein [Microbacterium sp. MYb66]|uniref:HNH endonuclease signature motif containing protein n=1 Tax=Microbacterium sp. MYb66 TaxID=1848692 RepID=UPI000CFFD2E5|nr:HNH endonuclease signature motif containing protein [Microbacterium sp. MYb66]PRA78483.1 HNH endonuclease [Microbacterium sp. MYb66]
MSRLDAAWAGVEDSADLSREQLIAVSASIGELRRRLDAVQVAVAAGISHESRPELGVQSLAKQHGFRTPATLIAAATGVSTGDASRLVKVGEATASRTDLVGVPRPARYPVVRDALGAGVLGAPAAALIVAVLDRCRVAAGAVRIAEGERVLVAKAQGLGVDDVRTLVTRAEAWLDPDGVEPKEEERRGKRSVTMFERDGMVHLNAVLDVETAAPVVAAFRGFVTAAFAARADAPDAGAADADRRTVPMIQADALAVFCAHVLGCEKRVPVAGATVIVRMSVEDLEAGTGSATIDGMDQPVSVGAARRMAAGGGIIPCVLGGDSEVLDWGREKRLFTRAQRLALVERDGGCAMCGLPPEMTKAHHIRWWKRDHGPTDLSNGVLLCETCHHRIHDNGWEIRIDGPRIGGRDPGGTAGGVGGAGGRAAARVWFLPPAYVDPARNPRLGGRARFDIAA